MKERMCRFLLLAAITLGTACLPLAAADETGPSWWLVYGVLDGDQEVNDFAAVNAGQLKHLATAARQAMEDNTRRGAGRRIDRLVASFNDSDNYRIVTVGELKRMAIPFYQRLHIQYPRRFWSPSGNDRPANIGQVKNLFSFELEKGKKVSRPRPDKSRDPRRQESKVRLSR